MTEMHKKITHDDITSESSQVQQNYSSQCNKSPASRNQQQQWSKQQRQVTSAQQSFGSQPLPVDYSSNASNSLHFHVSTSINSAQEVKIKNLSLPMPSLNPQILQKVIHKNSVRNLKRIPERSLRYDVANTVVYKVNYLFLYS